jgi:hypothetical protein
MRRGKVCIWHKELLTWGEKQFAYEMKNRWYTRWGTVCVWDEELLRFSSQAMTGAQIVCFVTTVTNFDQEVQMGKNGIDATKEVPYSLWERRVLLEAGRSTGRLSRRVLRNVYELLLGSAPGGSLGQRSTGHFYIYFPLGRFPRASVLPPDHIYMALCSTIVAWCRLHRIIFTVHCMFDHNHE